MEAPTSGREPLVNAPAVVIAVAALLVILHAAIALAPPQVQERLIVDWAVFPSRFEDPSGYQNPLQKWATLLTHGFLHGGWAHVLINATMLLALGAPVARRFGADAAGTARWILVFIASVVGGGVAFLALNPHEASLAVGASGGVSGMWAAAFLIDPSGRLRSPLSPAFLSMTAAFALANVAMVFIGPALAGAAVAWQAHAGGYVAGAIAMLVLGAGQSPQSLQDE
ncbi:rhomboid family intramembrane serine protease [bacterium]|nr:rhomboid family intramembrane serine protease [bacterium]